MTERIELPKLSPAEWLRLQLKPTGGRRDAQRRRAGKVRAAQVDRGKIKGRKP